MKILDDEGRMWDTVTQIMHPINLIKIFPMLIPIRNILNLNSI